MATFGSRVRFVRSGERASPDCSRPNHGSSTERVQGMDVTERTLKAAIERQHGGRAHLAYIDALPTTLRAAPIRDGIVFVFDLEGHPEAKRAYGWTSPVGNGDERPFYVVLQVPPILSVQDAVRSVTLAESQSAPHAGPSPRAPTLRQQVGPSNTTKPARAA